MKIARAITGSFVTADQSARSVLECSGLRLWRMLCPLVDFETRNLALVYYVDFSHFLWNSPLF